MRYKSFRIRNFKGIKDTTISFESICGASVFALVGLNESGKTTILEAVHSFSPDAATSELVGGTGNSGVPFEARVPRHLISTFTGDVSVVAAISLTEDDKAAFARNVARDGDIEIDIAGIPGELLLERRQNFKDGDFVGDYFSLHSAISVRGRKQRKWRDPDGNEMEILRDALYGLTPDIAYFPTFVFEFPESIYLTDRGGIKDRFYRRVFQDILDYDGKGHTILKDIVRRIRGEEMVVPWTNFLTLWGMHDDRAKIQHVMDRAGAVVTQLVFGRWNAIFREDSRGKEVAITYDVVEGEKIDAGRNRVKTHEHDVYIKFQVRDGTRRFDVNDRSLGFRWFFAFMLFTQFRVARSKSRPLLFLFDEPASNLHAAAQQKLIECFPGIAQGQHALAYTTHSHYMIEPKWLEQTFIVTNRADAPLSSVLDGISLDDESLDVQVATYRSFVNAHPNQTSFFQPILDRLEVVPSRFDMKRSSVVLEGKSDYYIVRYAAKLLNIEDLPLLPGLGAGTFGALAAISVGWGLDFLFVLDGDRQGKTEKKRYASEFGIAEKHLSTIDEFVPGALMIEDLLDEEAREAIKAVLKIAEGPSKSQIRRFFQESLASDKVIKLSDKFETCCREMLSAMQRRLTS